MPVQSTARPIRPHGHSHLEFTLSATLCFTPAKTRPGRPENTLAAGDRLPERGGRGWYSPPTKCQCGRRITAGFSVGAIVADARRIFAAATEARQRLQAYKTTWADKKPKAVRNFVKRFDTCLTYFDYPEPLRTLLKTNNPIERVMEEFRRRLNPMPAAAGWSTSAIPNGSFTESLPMS